MRVATVARVSKTMRKFTLVVMGSGIILAGLSILPFPNILIWNRTTSVPKGLYVVSTRGVLEHGDLVVYRPTEREKSWLEGGRYIARDWPLLKHVSGLPGDTICRLGRGILVNDVPVATAIDTDNLPEWSGCVTLSGNQVFLLNAHPRSIDGRYFGPQSTDQIAGKAIPVWVDNI